MMNLIVFFAFGLFNFISCEEIYQPVKYVDLSMYSGRWYQVYENYVDTTFQGKGNCSVADYTIIEDRVGVLNSQIDEKGNVDQIRGYAFYEDDNSGGELSVKLGGVPRTAPYWIIELGPIVNNQYDYSIVSDDKRITLFVLARNVEEFYKKYDDEVKESLNEFGFNKKFNKPIKMEQDGCNYALYDNVNLNKKNKLETNNCGVCGKSYQACCLAFGAEGYPCDCHLVDGTGKAGSNCGDCGVGYAACCIGYETDGYPCECDVL